jgi:hypothetical protein
MVTDVDKIYLALACELKHYTVRTDYREGPTITMFAVQFVGI